MDTIMTCEEFYDADSNVSYIYETVIQEQYWADGYDGRQLFALLKKRAAEQGVTLTDIVTFNDDRFFYDVYQCTEKGLS